MTNNNVKRNLISDNVAIIKVRRNNVIMGMWNENTGASQNTPVRTMSDTRTAIPAAATMTGDLIFNLVNNGYSGQLGLVVPDDIALKAFAAQKFINKGNVDGAKNFFDNNPKFSWLPEDYRSGIEYLIDAIAEAKENDVELVFTKESELFSWDLVGDFTSLKDGDKITLHAKQDENGFWTSTTEDGLIACSGNRVDGTFEVHETVIVNQSTGKSRSIWKIDRELKKGNEYDDHIRNLRGMYASLVEKLPGRAIFNPAKMVEVEELTA